MPETICPWLYPLPGDDDYDPDDPYDPYPKPFPASDAS